VEHRYALIVGIEHYNEAQHFIPLSLAQADARSLYELLIDPERGGWQTENVIYLTGDAATREEQIAAPARVLLAALLDARAQDHIAQRDAGPLRLGLFPVDRPEGRAQRGDRMAELLSTLNI